MFDHRRHYVSGFFSSTFICGVLSTEFPSIGPGNLRVAFCLSPQRCDLPVFQMSGGGRGEHRAPHSSPWLPSAWCESIIPLWCSRLTLSSAVRWPSLARWCRRESWSLYFLAWCHSNLLVLVLLHLLLLKISSQGLHSEHHAHPALTKSNWFSASSKPFNFLALLHRVFLFLVRSC